MSGRERERKRKRLKCYGSMTVINDPVLLFFLRKQQEKKKFHLLLRTIKNICI